MVKSEANKTQNRRNKSGVKKALEQKYLAIVGDNYENIAIQNSSVLFEQPNNITGRYFTTYNAGDIPIALFESREI